MKKEILKNIMGKIGVLGKGKVAAIAVASCVAVGGAGVGVHYVVTSVAGNESSENAVKEDKKAEMTAEEKKQYKDYQKRLENAIAAYSELILDESQDGLLLNGYEEVQNLIDRDLENGESSEETEQQLTILENNIEGFKKTSLEKLEAAEAGYRELYENHTVSVAEDGSDKEDFVVLDEATITTLANMQTEYDTLKSEEKYKSAFDKVYEMDNVINSYVASISVEEDVAQVDDTKNDDNGNDNGETPVPGDSTGQVSGDVEAPTPAPISTPTPAPTPEPNLDELYPELWAGQSMQSRIAHARYNLYSMTNYTDGSGVTYYGFYSVPAISGPDFDSHTECVNKIWEKYPSGNIVSFDLGDSETGVNFFGVPIS